MKLGKKLSLSFILLIVLSIILTSLIGNYKVNQNFNKYLMDEQLNRIGQVAHDLTDVYLYSNFALFSDKMVNYAMMEVLNIKLVNIDENIIASYNGIPTMGHSEHMGGMGMGRGMNGMRHRMGNSTGRYEEIVYPIGKTGDTIVIGYIDDYYMYSENVQIFRDTLTSAFALSGVITLIVSFFIISYLSRSLSNPILDIKNKTIDIGDGDLDHPLSTNTSVQELDELSIAINKLQDHLKIQETLRKEYATNISHELRTPISTIKSYLEAIQDEVWDLDEENLNILISEINNLSKLVDDLNNTFTSNSLIMNADKTEFNVSEYLALSIESFKMIFEENNIKVTTNITENLTAYIDQDMFRHIVYNLISNSIKYKSYENPKIDISLKPVTLNEVKSLELIILDNGTGIDNTEIDNIFDRFYRAENNKDITSGTGLGLSIVLNYVKLNNGDIKIQSKLNEFTKFIITLPIESK